jgi:hypothetical protein
VRRRPAPSAGFPGKARRHGAAKAWPRPIRPPCPGPRPRHHSRPARSSPGIEPPRARRPPWLPKPSSQRRQPLAHARGGGRQGTRRSARGASHRPGPAALPVGALAGRQALRTRPPCRRPGQARSGEATVFVFRRSGGHGPCPAVAARARQAAEPAPQRCTAGRWNAKSPYADASGLFEG